MNNTHVMTIHSPKSLDWRLVFGQGRKAFPVSASPPQTIQMYAFQPGQLFGMSRRRMNQYGTLEWEFLVMQAASPGEVLKRIPGVSPGAKLILHATTKQTALIAARVFKKLRGLGEDLDLHEVFIRTLEIPILAGIYPERALSEYLAKHMSEVGE